MILHERMPNAFCTRSISVRLKNTRRMVITRFHVGVLVEIMDIYVERQGGMTWEIYTADDNLF